MIDITEVIIALIGAAITVLTYLLIPYIKQRVTAEQFAEIQKWVVIGVQAAEMLYIGTGRGEEKKAYVTDFLNSKGYTLDAKSIENMIEAAVLQLKNSVVQ